MNCSLCSDTGRAIIKTLQDETIVCCSCPAGRTRALAEKEETYTMTFTCCNCGTKFTREVEIGRSAHAHGGSCPYCGVKDNDPWNASRTFKYRKPLDGEVESLS